MYRQRKVIAHFVMVEICKTWYKFGKSWIHCASSDISRFHKLNNIIKKKIFLKKSKLNYKNIINKIK